MMETSQPESLESINVSEVVLTKIQFKIEWMRKYTNGTISCHSIEALQPSMELVEAINEAWVKTEGTFSK